MAKNLTSRAQDYSKWYNELVIQADLAENSGDYAPIATEIHHWHARRERFRQR